MLLLSSFAHTSAQCFRIISPRTHLLYTHVIIICTHLFSAFWLPYDVSIICLPTQRLWLIAECFQEQPSVALPTQPNDKRLRAAVGDLVGVVHQQAVDGCRVHHLFVLAIVIMTMTSVDVGGWVVRVQVSGWMQGPPPVCVGHCYHDNDEC